MPAARSPPPPRSPAASTTSSATASGSQTSASKAPQAGGPSSDGWGAGSQPNSSHIAVFPASRHSSPAGGHRRVQPLLEGRAGELGVRSGQGGPIRVALAVGVGGVAPLLDPQALDRKSVV